MHYGDERTHGCRVSDAWTYRGLKTVVMENSLIRVLVLADKGADIYSFVHKPTDTEFMWRSPWGVRDPRPFVPSTGSNQGMWLDYYEGGWQTALPHGGYPDEVYGAEFGLHAELNNLPWDATIVEDSAWSRRCQLQDQRRSDARGGRYDAVIGRRIIDTQIFRRLRSTRARKTWR